MKTNRETIRNLQRQQNREERLRRMILRGGESCRNKGQEKRKKVINKKRGGWSMLVKERKGKEEVGTERDASKQGEIKKSEEEREGE